MRWSFLFVVFSLSTVSSLAQEAGAPEGGDNQAQVAAQEKPAAEPAADPPAQAAPAPNEPAAEDGGNPADAAAAAQPVKAEAAADGAAQEVKPAKDAPVTAEPAATAPLPAPDQSLVLEKVVEYMLADREVQRLKPWADYYNKVRKQNDAMSENWRRVASRLEQVQAARDTAAKYLEANCPHVKRFIDSEAARVSADWGKISGQK